MTGIVILCGLLVTLNGCGGPDSAGPAEGAIATFATTYPKALRALTDLGLMPAASVCGSGIRYQSASGSWWQPTGVEAAFTTSNGQLVLWPTPLAAPDWPSRIPSAGASHITLYARNTPFNCASPRIIQGTPPPGASRIVAADQLNMLAQVVFAGSSVSYDTALNAITDLGLRLANLCYEQAQARDGTPSWHAMGQESGFASAGALVVAPTFAASASWRDQIRALP